MYRFLLLGCLVVGCADSPAFLTRFVDVAPGLECIAGGIRVDNGFDDDHNEFLGPGEITKSTLICHDSVLSLTDVTEEPPGADCVTGGVKISVGFDADGDRVLDLDEVSSVDYVCQAVVQVVRAGDATATVPMVGETNMVSAQMTVAAPGAVIAFGSALVHCTSAACPTGVNAAGFWTATHENGYYGADLVYINSPADIGESFAITQRHLVRAGTHSFFLRGYSFNGAPVVHQAFLTLVYFAEQL